MFTSTQTLSKLIAIVISLVSVVILINQLFIVRANLQWEPTSVAPSSLADRIPGPANAHPSHGFTNLQHTDSAQFSSWPTFTKSEGFSFRYPPSMCETDKSYEPDAQIEIDVRIYAHSTCARDGILEDAEIRIRTDADLFSNFRDANALLSDRFHFNLSAPYRPLSYEVREDGRTIEELSFESSSFPFHWFLVIKGKKKVIVEDQRKTPESESRARQIAQTVDFR